MALGFLFPPFGTNYFRLNFYSMHPKSQKGLEKKGMHYVILLILALSVLAGPNALAFGDFYQGKPLLLEFNEKADLIIVGRVAAQSRYDDNAEIAEIEIERIISAVWEEGEIQRHLKSDGRTARLSVLVNVRLSSANSGLLAHARSNERYLCWLKLTKNQSARGLEPSEYFIPVKVSTGFDSAELGIVKLNYLQKLISPEVYKGMQEIGGKEYDPRLAADQAMRWRYGTADREEIVRITCLFSKIMSASKNNEEQRKHYEELQRLTRSSEKIIAEIASLLAKMGMMAQRFRFVDVSE
jgi:hypothetical protein